MDESKTIFAEVALTKEGWADNVQVSFDERGAIASVIVDKPELRARSDRAVGILLPSLPNVHSHSFQRALAGLTESRGPASFTNEASHHLASQTADSFWTWRELMYRFVGELTPDDVESIATFVQMEMLEAGYASVGEFHYLHHDQRGRAYDDVGEMSGRIAAAAQASGIGLTLLPVLYEQSSCVGGELNALQQRFGCSLDEYENLLAYAQKYVSCLFTDALVGVAPHSLRAVGRDSLVHAVSVIPDAPVHIHVAEQIAEIEEVKDYFGQRPVAFLLDNFNVDARWCLIHATHMNQAETIELAKSGAIAGICPITEASLGDGVFNGAEYLKHQGGFGIGSDSNIHISLSEELRLFEYSQRLKDKRRAVMATQTASTGRVLYQHAAVGGAQALGRRCGEIEVGYLADLVALDRSNINLFDKTGDSILDAFIFASNDSVIQSVWAAGRHLVDQGRHIHRDTISNKYKKTITSLRGRC